MSAVIYAAIVVMWAVVLVPMWLRRHDAATESRSVDRFSTAMRTLSRRTTSAPGRRYVVMPRRSDGGVSVHVSGAAAAPPAPPRPASRPRPAAPRRRTSIVARRRRMLLGVLAVTFVTFVLAVAGAVSWPLQVVVDVILVAFCMHLRAQARRAAAVSRQRRRATVATDRPAPRPARQAPQPARVPASAPVTATAVEDPLPPLAVEEEPLAATGTDDASADLTWEPVPVPRPTYTMKPPAPPVPAYEPDPLRDTDPHNTMEASYDAASYEGAPGHEVIATEGVATVETDLDDILERRWAVND